LKPTNNEIHFFSGGFLCEKDIIFKMFFCEHLFVNIWGQSLSLVFSLFAKFIWSKHEELDKLYCLEKKSLSSFSLMKSLGIGILMQLIFVMSNLNKMKLKKDFIKSS